MHIAYNFFSGDNHAEETLPTSHLEFRNVIIKLLETTVSFGVGYI